MQRIPMRKPTRRVTAVSAVVRTRPNCGRACDRAHSHSGPIIDGADWGCWPRPRSLSIRTSSSPSVLIGHTKTNVLRPFLSRCFRRISCGVLCISGTADIRFWYSKTGRRGVQLRGFCLTAVSGFWRTVIAIEEWLVCQRCAVLGQRGACAPTPIPPTHRRIDRSEMDAVQMLAVKHNQLAKDLPQD